MFDIVADLLLAALSCPATEQWEDECGGLRLCEEQAEIVDGGSLAAVGQDYTRHCPDRSHYHPHFAGNGRRITELEIFAAFLPFPQVVAEVREWFDLACGVSLPDSPHFAGMSVAPNLGVVDFLVSDLSFCRRLS